MGRHRDDESSGSVTEASERLSAQPAILYYKAQTASVFEHAAPAGTPAFGAHTASSLAHAAHQGPWCPVNSACKKRWKVVARLTLIFRASRLSLNPGSGAHTQEKHGES
jgi:hypothetical protein